MHRVVGLAAILPLSRPVVAQQIELSPAAARHEAAPVVRAARLTGDIQMDGKLDERAWSAATPVSQFTQLDPNEGAPASEKTEVRVLIGDDALYVGARLFESNLANIRRRLARRDEPVDGDVFAVAIDSRHDHISAYFFRVAAGGAIRDAVVGTGQEGDQQLDLSWDAVWEAAVSTDAQGWSVEIRIPLSQLPYNRSSDPVWGIQFERYHWNKQEQDFFSFTPKSERAGVQRYGHLVGLGQLPAPSRLELLPYVGTRAEYLDIAPANPFRDGSEYVASAGLDLKYRLTSSLTFNATANPDFGQVEVDPAVVNLTAFETFFPEKRPFFVEGQELFRFGELRTRNSYSSPTLFFSRRIGRQPQRALDGADVTFVDAPEQTTILAAGKLTGKTSGGWSIGALEAVTDRETADYVDGLGAQRSTTVEPLTNYFVGRVRREMRAGNTVVGGLFSAVNRHIDDPALDAGLRSGAYVAGVDLSHAWADRSWALDASFAGSYVRGSASAIAATQLSSARYYNRPDAESFAFDPTRTSLTGYSGQIAVTKTAGRHWLGNLAYQGTSPGFEVNDLGFQTGADRHALSTDLAYQETRPGRILRNWTADVFTNQAWNSDGDLVYNNYAAAAFGMFRNFSGLNLRVDYGAPALDDRLTRGGPVAEQPRTLSTRADFFTDRRKVYSAEFSASYGTDDAGGQSWSAGVIFAVQPSSSLRVSLEPQYSDTLFAAQYVSASADPLATRTFGTRYVFAELEQRQLALLTRIDWTFSPRLSLQLFAQPLVAAGEFRNFKEFHAARTFDFDIYGRDVGTISRVDGVVTIDPDGDAATDNRITFADPDFNFRSLRGSAVLRWEYRPGSTLFFVWQQRRAGVEPVGDLRFGRDYEALFREQPENIFAIKATYWIAR